MIYTKFWTLPFLTIFLLPFSLFTICREPTAPEETIKLELSNGYFQQVNTTPTKVYYAVSFDYRVTGTKCLVGGYGIEWNLVFSTSINWYCSQELSPYHTYTIADTFSCSPMVILAPKVSMQGYYQDASGIDQTLEDELTLQKR